MATRMTTTHICDRCDAESEGTAGLDFPAGYVAFGPVNGSNSDHVGSRNFKTFADICESCRLDLLRWWRKEVTR